jgi:hypothetical protein
VGFGDAILSAGRVGTTGGQPVANIIEFVDSLWGLGGTNFRLYPVQRVILKATYGIKLEDTIPTVKVWGDMESQDGWREGWRREKENLITEADYLRYLHKTGRSNISEVIPGKERREMVLSVGRRSGKTFMSACIAAYETYKLVSKGSPQEYYGLPDSDIIQLISVATDKDQAGILFQGVSGHFNKCDFFKPYMANNTMSYVKFQTPADIQKFGPFADHQNPNSATVRVTFKSCVAKGLRGSGNICVILDEFAHFTDGTQSSADTIYQAVKPSLSAFTAKDPLTKQPIDPDAPSEGRIIMISSPLGRQGKFYAQYQIGMRGGLAAENMLCIQAPTWEVNPTLAPGEFAANYATDAASFFTEYGGEFTDRTRGWIKDPADLYACINPAARARTSAPPRKPHFMGIDFALANDATAIAIGHLDENHRIVLDLVDQIKAGEGRYEDLEGRLDFDAVADWIKGICSKFYIAEGMFDQWSGIAFEQALGKRGLRQLRKHDFTRPLTSQLFKNFKDMMFEDRLVLYDFPIEEGKEHADYILELCALQETVHTKYISTVEAPNTEGSHDDRADAIVRMVWLASQAAMGMPTFGRNTGRRGQKQQPGHQAPNSRQMVLGHAKRLAGGSHPSRMTGKARLMFGNGMKRK